MSKLESKSKKCIFIGFTKGVKGFRLWDPEKKSAFTSIDVVFDEDSMLREKSKTEDKAQVELQTVRQQTLRKRESSSQIAIKGLKGQKSTPQIQMEINRRLLKSNLDR